MRPRNLLVAALLAAIPTPSSAQSPICWDFYPYSRAYDGPVMYWHTFTAHGWPELVPTGQGVGMILHCHYPSAHTYPYLPLTNWLGTGRCPDDPQDVILAGWWWHDLWPEQGDELTCPNGARLDMFRYRTGMMIAPTLLPAVREDGWYRGLSCYRFPSQGRWEPSVSPTYTAYLILPARGWW